MRTGLTDENFKIKGKILQKNRETPLRTKIWEKWLKDT